MSFVHLHNHTTYSMLDGAQKLKPMIQAAIRDGQPAIATTDHGNVYSLIEFYQECKKQGIKPILGTEAYMARNSVDERPKMRKKKNEEGGETEEGSKLYHHLTVLAENNAGYQNLIKLSSRAYLEGFYYKPRIDWDILSDHSEGVIATTGCLGGIVLQELLHDRPQEALRAAGRLQDILGPDNLFVELQDHGIPEQARTNPGLIEISKKLGAPLVVTNDAHYVARSDAHAHDVLLCCNTHAKIHETDRFKFHGEEHYLKTAQEMGMLFPDYPEASSNTLLIGERCNVEIEFGKNLVPRFPVPDGFDSEDEYLRYLVSEGAQERWAITDEVANRLDYELETICNMGMAGYFLILWDLCRHAHKVGIRIGPARGSAGGCAVAYCLRITDVDPLRWGLLFERFLNPARVSMPDIDLDIPGRFRDHMINYTRQKYGDDRVCQIVTFSQIRSRNAIRDAARVLDKPLSLSDKVAKSLPPLVFGRDTPLSACLEQEEGYEDGFVRADQFRNMYASDSEVREIVDAALGIEGLHRSDGIHAAAVVIAPGPLTDYVPVQRKPNKGKEGPLTTQYEMNAVESLGLLKMDYLGLKTLDVISDAVDLIKKRTGQELDLSSLNFIDQATFDLLQEGKTLGVFQLESAPMRDLLRRLKPDTFEDIAAVLALYRPGPMAANMHNAYADRKNGLEPIEVFHADVADILEETYGLMVYQEQLMNVAMRLAGYELADGYQLVKTCAKKIPAAMEAERSKFTGGMINKGYDPDFATAVFDMVADFANYAFNKSHSYGYGYITYWTAYLKANYPVEFMTACLTNAAESDRLGVVLQETRDLGIEVLPPDVNISQREFAPVSQNQISFGLASIRGVGDEPADDIVVEREQNGNYKDFFDYVHRSSKKAMNSKIIEGLVYAGAFSAFGHPRRGLASIFKEVIQQEQKDRNNAGAGAISLFDVETYYESQGVPDLEYKPIELLDFERVYLGVWLTGHPLEGLTEEVETASDMSLAELADTPEIDWRRRTRIAGIVVNLVERITRKGDPMKTFDIQDLGASIPCVLFPNATRQYGYMVNEGDVLALTVNPQDDQSGIKLVVEEVQQLRKNTLQQSGNIHLFLPDDYPIDTLKHQLKQTTGDSSVFMHWLGQSVKVDARTTLEAVKEVLD